VAGSTVRIQATTPASMLPSGSTPVAPARQSIARGLAPLALARLLLAGLLCHARPVYRSACDHCRYQAIQCVNSAGTASGVWRTQVPHWFSLPGD